MFRHLSLIAKNGLRNRRRSALTLMSLAVSLCLMGVLGSAYRVLFLAPNASPAEALRLITHHKVSITQPMPVSHERTILNIPGVRDAMVWQWFGGAYKDGSDPRNFFARFAVEPHKLFGIRSEIELPEDQKAAFEKLRAGCIAGEQLATKLGWRLGDRVTLVGDIFPVTLELTVVGIYRNPGDDETLFFNYEYLREMIKTSGQPAQADRVGVFQVRIASPDDVTRISASIDKEFENSAAPTKTESERAWQLGFLSFLGNLRLFLLSICGALTFTILLVSANTISMSVRERIREIGVLKTLGFTPGAVLGLILGESAFIALLGGLLGILLAMVTCVVVRNSGSSFAALKLSVTPDIAVAVLIVAAAIGLLSALVPAWRASRTSILDALRSVG